MDASAPFEAAQRPAYYAKRGRLGDWWTLLHPPYTGWHLSYVVIGAALAPRLDLTRLAATLAAFFLAVGLAAHALDELHGRPLRTAIPGASLVALAAVGLTGAAALGIAGILVAGPGLLPFVVVGVFLVLAYDLELFGGLIHTDWGFDLAWGAFPVLTAYFAQAGRLGLVAFLAAAVSCGLTQAQRSLSNRARLIRRRAEAVDGAVVVSGTAEPLVIDRQFLLAPIEQALSALSWTAMALGAALAVFRLT